MKSTRKDAILVGILFILGTGTGVIAAALLNPILNAPDYLSRITAHENQIVIAAFLQFLMAMSCAGIGLALYPVIKKYHAGLAIGPVGFRVIEGMIQVLGAVSTICLLALSREAVSSGNPGAEIYQTMGAVIKAGSDWISNGPMLISWCIGAAMYYYAFYRYGLLPRWLSGWGLIGITLTIIASILVMIGTIPSFGTIQVAANLPIALQEMVLAVWLIAKGFNIPATAK